MTRKLWATWRAAFAEAVANRRGFWTQLVVMVVNDIVWVVFWVLFFDAVGDVRGWDRDAILTLLAILTTSGGIVLGFGANARHIGTLATDGGLDATLALPVPPLLHLLSRKVHASNVGDLAFGVGLFVVAGSLTPQRIALFVVAVVCSTTILGGFLVFVGSLAFWAGRNDAGDLGFHSMVMFASYPVDVFGGAAKVFLYTVVPAGFVSSVPTRAVDELDLLALAGVAAVAVGVAAIAAGTFHAGLRRYTSGSAWTRA